MLKVESISASYGAIVALENVSLEVPNGKIVALLGANGAGKSTTLNCISSMVRLKTGRITFNDQLISGLSPDEVVSRGIVQVPEGREIFPDLSISDNLLVGTWLRRKSDSKADFDRVFELFPRLKERLKQDAGTLSGGEQQMLMIGRAIMAKPKILLLDEPSLGLSPVLIESIFEVIQQLNGQGTTILLVEQNTRMALSVCHYAYVLENGEIKLHGSADKLANDPAVREAYLGS
ncbi:MAG: ABC transporter ATP-binding protein [Betaproteobacteria bacterium]|jgi:branched-chain amino acid transport system ATP-binding protein|nr:ABC transporter ATP-binding protein [Betaproteobacteria bacterium]